MKKRAFETVIVSLLLTVSLSGCGIFSLMKPSQEVDIEEDPGDNGYYPGDTEIEAPEPEEEEPEEVALTDEELFDEFLKDRAEVHFHNYQPDQYFEINVPMFGEGESVTLSELLAIYDEYFMEELSYDVISKEIGYTYIDAGDAGKQQLVVESRFPQGGNTQFVIEAVDGQLEMMYTIDSYYREYATVANKYGLINSTVSYSYDQYAVTYTYLDEKGQVHPVYTEEVSYSFGEETNLADPLLEWAAEFKADEGFENDVILRTYYFDEPDSPPAGENRTYDYVMYTVEYYTNEEPWHEDSMYEEGSIFRKIFGKAGRVLSTPEEIEAAIADRKNDLGMPENAKEEDPVILTDMSAKEIGAVFGADVDDGRSELEHALTAYTKYLKNPLNMCDILTDVMASPFGDFQPGLIYGFALRDFTEDGIPELVIDYGQPGFALFQKIYIYQYNENDGSVSLMFDTEVGNNGNLGIAAFKKDADEEYLSWLEEDYNNKVAQCPDYADSLLNVKYEGPKVVGTYGRYLVTFNSGIEEDMSETVTWYDFVEDRAQYYIEDLQYADGYGESYDYSVEDDCIDDPEEIVFNYKPILFYDFTEDNIETVVSEEYWNANSGADGFSDYSAEDACDYLCDKAQWYLDLGIMDDDNSYDTVSSYFYDPDTEISSELYFDPEKRIQSHLRMF